MFARVVRDRHSPDPSVTPGGMRWRWREHECESNGATDIKTGPDHCSHSDSSPFSDWDIRSNSSIHRGFASYSGFHIGAYARPYFAPNVGAAGP